jgi:hypothetical protein
MSLRVLEGIADKSGLLASRDDIERELDAGRRSDLHQRKHAGHRTGPWPNPELQRLNTSA